MVWIPLGGYSIPRRTRNWDQKGKGIRVPLVPSAVIYDLGFINHRVRPDFNDGYAAEKTRHQLTSKQVVLELEPVLPLPKGPR
ncbi:MAG: hypothetical protein Ct9H300mP19_20200 [Dehalococcoidia bacterium]|nr:MAG: hypothetical protein Ct9H300mP19_20200 [Dehalococcoidia bacterium]